MIIHSPKTLLGALTLSLLASSLVPAANLHIRILEDGSGKVTPAMICITGSDNKVRLPPDGRILARPSTTKEFYQGVEFHSDRNWIGPVRKMQGIGNNNDRSYVYDLLPSIPYWKEAFSYQVSGDFNIKLPPGKWRLAVEHGPEYIPITQEFELADHQTVTRTVRLKRWINLPQHGWWSGDVHVHHPALKDSHRQFLLKYAQAADLHIVNVLEMGHHRGTDFKQEGFGKPFRARLDDYCIVPGQEEPRSTFGHIIGLNTTHLARDLPTYDFYDLAFKRIHQQKNALVGFAHFAWNGCDLPRGFPWYVTTGELDFIELLQFSKINSMDYYDYLNLGFKLTAAAGSDTPWGSTIGEVRTYVHTGQELDVDAWFQGLKQGNSFVSNGPFLEFLVDDQLPGSEINKSAGDIAKITARVLGHPGIGLPASLTIVGNDGVIKQATNSGSERGLSIELEKPIHRSQWLVASAVCDNGALAHTTPVYLFVGGLPSWCPERGPAVIEKQLQAIGAISKEVSPPRNDREKGIEERLNRARKYYRYILRKMKEQTTALATE